MSNQRKLTNKEMLEMIEGMLLTNREENWLKDMLNEIRLIVLENELLEGLTDEKSNLIEIMVKELSTYKLALEMIADHKNTLYAAIAQKALDEVHK